MCWARHWPELAEKFVTSWSGGRQDEEPPPLEGALLERLPALAECFEHREMRDVLAALRQRSAEESWAAEAVKALETCARSLLT